MVEGCQGDTFNPLLKERCRAGRNVCYGLWSGREDPCGIVFHSIKLEYHISFIGIHIHMFSTLTHFKILITIMLLNGSTKSILLKNSETITK